MAKINSYRDLIVWQKAMELVVLIYELTEHFPKEERFGLTSQMRRAAVSIASNIAEGSCRGTRKDYRQFVIISLGSGAELETQIELAKRLPFGRVLDYTAIDSLLAAEMRMLNALVERLGVRH